MLDRFAIDEETIRLDSTTGTLFLTVTARAADYSELKLIEMGWSIFQGSAALKRLVVTVDLPAADVTYRN